MHRILQVFVRCGKEGNRTNYTAGYIAKVCRKGPFEPFLGVMVIVKTAHSVVACEHHPSGIAERNAPAEDSTAEEYSLGCKDCFKMCNDLFLFGKAAGQTVKHVVKTDTFKGVAHCGKGQEKIVPDKVGFKPFEPARSPCKATGAEVKQGQCPLF